MSKLSERIRSQSFAVTTELTPPKGIDLSDLLGKADALKDLVDGVNLTDSPRARMAIEPKCVGKLLLDRGIEPIVQFTSRDRNRIALQGDMLGAALLGIENLVFMGGDDPKNGDHPEAKGVFDLNASDMLRAARALTNGKDMNGNDLKGTPVLFLGATANPGAKDLAAEVQNTRRKIEAGAQFLQTQAVYDPADLLKFVDALKPDSVALLVGIIPLKSYKMATWLNANVPGIHVPENLLKELEAVQGDAEAEVRLGIDIAARTIQALKPHCAGVHLMTMGWERYVPDILKASGIR